MEGPPNFAGLDYGCLFKAENLPVNVQGHLLWERLTEEKLTERFKASRSPIREALRQLESEGLIRFEQNKGIPIYKPSIKEIEEIYDLRCLLEGYSVRLSIKQITNRHLEYLNDLNRNLKSAVENSDLSSWIQNNILFHDFFPSICGNTNLNQILTNLKRRVSLYHYNIVSLPGHFKTYLGHHEGILKACQKRDGNMAEKHMRFHIETIKNILMGYLNKMNSI